MLLHRAHVRTGAEGQREARWAPLLRPLHPRELPLSGWALTLWSGVWKDMEKELFLKSGCQHTIFLWVPGHYIFIFIKIFFSIFSCS